MTSPFERNVLEWDVKQQTLKYLKQPETVYLLLIIIKRERKKERERERERERESLLSVV